jgi:hypothetical protein
MANGIGRDRSAGCLSESPHTLRTCPLDATRCPYRLKTRHGALVQPTDRGRRISGLVTAFIVENRSEFSKTTPPYATHNCYFNITFETFLRP